VDFLKDEIGQKSNIKDVCVLVDMKANSEDLRRSIEEVQKSVQVQQPLDVQIVREQKIMSENF